MGKSLSPLGVTRGKVGSVVYYRLANSNNKERQGSREYVASVRNPQSDLQIDQRVKLAAVNNCYRVMKHIIRRSFEGTEYGDPSRRRWTSLALGQQFAGPFIDKDVKTPLPIAGVPISIGSLPEIQVSSFVADDPCSVAVALPCRQDSLVTVANLSAALINAEGSWIEEGDQLTFCYVSYAEPSGVGDSVVIQYRDDSFFVNTNDQTALTSVLGFEITPEVSSLTMEFAGITPVAVAVILSREGSHLRSTANWGLSDEYAQWYQGATVKNRARDSYKRGGTTRSSDWPVEPGVDVPVPPISYKADDDVAHTLIALRVAGTGGYLVAIDDHASQYYLMCKDTSSSLYQKFLTGFASASSSAPSGTTAHNVISFKQGTSATADELAFVNWLIANGVNERFLLLGAV